MVKKIKTKIIGNYLHIWIYKSGSVTHKTKRIR